MTGIIKNHYLISDERIAIVSKDRLETSKLNIVIYLEP